MVKKTNDEPDDKALERLRQFEDSRKPVPAPGADPEKEKKKKHPGKPIADQAKPGNQNTD